MESVTTAYDRRDERGFVRRRLVALVIVVLLVCAAGALFGLLVLGPHLARWVGEATGDPSLTEWLWWTAQWPILLFVLFVAFAVVLYLGPDVDHKRWHLITPGSVVALVVWLASSGALAYYSARFGSFEKTWGTLSAVVVTLIWLWLGAVGLLFGAQLNAQYERRRGAVTEPERRP
jgi:membrane protein